MNTAELQQRISAESERNIADMPVILQVGGRRFPVQTVEVETLIGGVSVVVVGARGTAAGVCHEFCEMKTHDATAELASLQVRLETAKTWGILGWLVAMAIFVASFAFLFLRS